MKRDTTKPKHRNALCSNDDDDNDDDGDHSGTNSSVYVMGEFSNNSFV